MVELLVVPDRMVDETISLKECIQAVEDSIVEYSSGRTLMPHKLHLDIPGSSGFLRVMPAAIPKLGYGGVKVYLDPSYNAVNSPAMFLLLEIGSGLPVALIGANRLSQLRTGAASAVATKWLAIEDASVAGVIGSGPHARTQLEGSTVVRRIKAARVYSPTSEHRESFAKEMGLKLGIEVTPVKTARASARNADVISVATTSRTPVLASEDVSDGAHINTIGSSFPGRSELESSLFLKSKVVVDCASQALGGVEGGDLSGLIEKGLMDRSDLYGEMGEIVLGSKPGRTNEKEITIFKNTGMAIWDVACAARIYEWAAKRSVGAYVEI